MALFKTTRPVGGAAEPFGGEGRTFRMEESGTHLRTPGLTELFGVRIGNTLIPLRHEQHFPNNQNYHEKVKFDLPLLMMDRDEDGCPVVLRSLQSNDGIWQAGVAIQVYGDWEQPLTDAQKKAAEKAEAEAKAKAEAEAKAQEEAARKAAEEAAKKAAEAAKTANQ